MEIERNVEQICGFRKGMKVICTDEHKKDEHGGGWVKGRIFTIDRISKHRLTSSDEIRYIMWPNIPIDKVGLSGVYMEYIRPLYILPDELFKL